MESTVDHNMIRDDVFFSCHSIWNVQRTGERFPSSATLGSTATGAKIAAGFHASRSFLISISRLRLSKHKRPRMDERFPSSAGCDSEGTRAPFPLDTPPYKQRKDQCTETVRATSASRH